MLLYFFVIDRYQLTYLIIMSTHFIIKKHSLIVCVKLLSINQLDPG